MTAAILAIALVVTLALLVCALVGGSAIRDELRDRLADAEAERDAAWLDRFRDGQEEGERRSIPPVRPITDTPHWEALATERHLAAVRRLPGTDDAS